MMTVIPQPDHHHHNKTALLEVERQLHLNKHQKRLHSEPKPEERNQISVRRNTFSSAAQKEKQQNDDHHHLKQETPRYRQEQDENSRCYRQFVL
jgi:hypothetical protein